MLPFCSYINNHAWSSAGSAAKNTTTNNNNKKAYIINEGCEGFWKGCFAIFLFKNPITGFQQPHKYQVMSIRFHEHTIPYYGILEMLIIQCVCI